MAQVPRFDPADVATKADIAELRDGFAAVNQRLDRLFLALLVGSFGIVATMLGMMLTFG